MKFFDWRRLGGGRKRLCWLALLTSFVAGPLRANPSLEPSLPAAPEAAFAQTTALLSAPSDEPARHVKRHYLWSNERRHDLFFAELAKLGGGYIGVGGDQNYTLAAAAQAKAVWLIDLDAAVVHMHKLYAALLVGAATPAEFLARFEKNSTAAVHTAVAARYASAEEQHQALEIYHAYRDLLRSHLRATLRAKRSRSWLADAQKYQHIRELALSGRLVALLGDLTGPRTVLEIADAAQQAKISIRTLYFSNAESWFHYGAAFRRNIIALPFDDKSLVLRTVKSQLLGYPHSDIWHYTLQRAQHFSTKLGQPEYRSVDVAMLDAASGAGAKRGLSYIGFEPERNLKPLFAAKAASRRNLRRTLLATGLVTRPAGNRECASEMDRHRLRRAALELNQ